MTIDELISRLRAFPGDTEVEFLCPDGYQDTIVNVELGESICGLLSEPRKPAVVIDGRIGPA